MIYNDFVKLIQGHFTDGLVLVIGSGLSAAEGIPGMPELATHLSNQAYELKDNDLATWAKVKEVLNTNEGLEAALLKHAPPATLESWLVKKTCDLLMPAERDCIGSPWTNSFTSQRTQSQSELLSYVTNYEKYCPDQ